MHSTQSTVRAILTPCTGVCTLGADGYCHGCQRTGEEIARWSVMGDAERERLMQSVLPQRESGARMSACQAQLLRIRAALHAPDAVPCGAGWNVAELQDLLPERGDRTPAAVMVGLIPRAAGFNVLLTVRSGELRHHAGQVSFPGGRIEADDADAIDAALREAHEEVGLERTQAEPLGWLDPLVTVTGFRILPLVVRIAPDFVPVADPREVAEIFEMPLDYLLAADNIRRVQVEYRGRARAVLEYVPFPGIEARIWGATASILHNLTWRLAQAGDAMKGLA